MTPKALLGLNLVVQPSTTTAEASDESDILSSKNRFSDIAAQLDLWTNLAFESDDPLKSTLDSVDFAEDDNSISSDGLALPQAHVNVVMANSPTFPASTITPTPPDSTPTPPIDLNQFFAGFGIDSFPPPNVQSPAIINPSLAQLLALHPFPTAPFTGAQHPLPQQPPHPPQQQADNGPQHQNKRPRTRKSSSSSTIDEPGDYSENTTTSANTALSIAEDKRRRNTAASARFRLKKKEREAALEARAKELETKVTELERECEGLRRENGWLKGLVVGVTGASANANAATTGVKRARDEETDR